MKHNFMIRLPVNFVNNTGSKPTMIRLAIAVLILNFAALAFGGAIVPWTTYEAETMTNSGMILGPQYSPHVAASEA